MQINRCNEECSYFRWGEQGLNYKAYCLKDSKFIKDMGACPMRWATKTVNPEIQVSQ